MTPKWSKVKLSLRPPPLDFEPIDACVWAEYSETPPTFIREVHRRGKRRAGILYEQKAQREFRDQFGDRYMPSQWVRYRRGDDGRVRWCQPDGVLLDPARRSLTIIEFKYNHTENAWWQLFKLYLPVLERLFDGQGYEFRCVEVCKWMDPAIRCPQRPRLLDDVEKCEVGDFGVHIWSP